MKRQPHFWRPVLALSVVLALVYAAALGAMWALDSFAAHEDAIFLPGLLCAFLMLPMILWQAIFDGVDTIESVVIRSLMVLLDVVMFSTIFWLPIFLIRRHRFRKEQA
jgi:hypothetical protein